MDNSNQPVYNSNQPVSDWGNTMYDGLSGVGTFKADLIMIIALIVGLVLVVIGIYMISTDDSDLYLKVKGLVVEPNCVKSSTTYDDKGRPIDTYKCNILITYKVNGTAYSKKMYLAGQSNYIKDEPINLIIRKDDLENVQIESMNRTSMGSLMIIGSLVLVALAYLNYYLTHNYKIWAAAQGTETIVNLFR
jgi:hypothetical protein